MKHPKISVILPFFNAETTLKRALDSILNQSFSNFECIMVDNNSTDNSQQIALHYSNIDNRFILIEESKQGVVYASNKALQYANGEYIARMDADDKSYNIRLESQLDFLVNNKEYGAVSGKVNFIPKTNNYEGFQRYVDWVNSLKNYDDIFIKRFVEMPVINPSMMWRKSVCDKYGMYRSGDFPEDYELWLRWLDSGVRIGKVNKYILKWYDSDSRLTRTDNIYSNDSFYKAKSPYLAKYLSKVNRFHPKVIVWGASKISRKRAQLLQKYGIEIIGYIDISLKRQIPERIIHFMELPKMEKSFVLVYVKQKAMREKIELFLYENNYIEGTDYLLIS